MTMTNQHRADRCLKALTAYSVDDAFTALVDILADAMHFCERTEHDFRLALAQACRHYLHEIIDEQHYERRTLP